MAAEGEGGAKGKKTRFVIRIHPCVSASTFKVAKLAPNRNNVRRTKCDALLPEGTPAAAEGAGETATPRYNATILSDILMEHHLELLYEGVYGASRKSIDNAPDATLLLKTWLRQRGMTGDVFGAFSGFTVSMLIYHLFQIRKITRRSSSFQIFRAVVAFIATSDWTTEGVAMKCVWLGCIYTRVVRLHVVRLHIARLRVCWVARLLGCVCYLRCESASRPAVRAPAEQLVGSCAHCRRDPFGVA